MLKKSLKTIGLILIIGFSFYYTDKVVNVVRNQDPLMIKIKQYEASFNKDSVNAFIEDNLITPGINACVVDTNASYNKMKKTGNYNSNMIEYREIKPRISLDNVYNKYIIKGNRSNYEVALVFKLSDKKHVVDLINALSKKGIKASFFVDGKLVEDETESMYNLVAQGHELYNLGYDNKYDKDLLVWTNNILENISNNRPKYCLVTSENQSVLDLCSLNKMYTIKANLYINYSNDFNTIKNSIEKGSIIVYDVNDKTTTELNKTLLFLNSKGYSYNLLSKHLSERGCAFDKK